MEDRRNDEVLLRAMVQLVETQAQQLHTLKATLDDLEGRLRLRAELDALLGHEVRTPLTVIRGALHALRGSLGDDGERAMLLERALGQAVHLGDIVNDLMQTTPGITPQLSRARTATFRLGDLVDRVVEAVSPVLPAAAIVRQLDEELQVSTSRPRAVAIMANLLENAARHGQGGPEPVELGIAMDGQDLVIEVADRGPGLGGADPEALFEPFIRGHRAAATGGLGVGLYLVRMLAGSLGGEAALCDRPDGGAVATVRLPQRRGGDPATPKLALVDGTA